MFTTENAKQRTEQDDVFKKKQKWPQGNNCPVTFTFNSSKILQKKQLLSCPLLWWVIPYLVTDSVGANLSLRFLFTFIKCSALSSTHRLTITHENTPTHTKKNVFNLKFLCLSQQVKNGYSWIGFVLFFCLGRSIFLRK